MPTGARLCGSRCSEEYWSSRPVRHAIQKVLVGFNVLLGLSVIVAIGYSMLSQNNHEANEQSAPASSGPTPKVRAVEKNETHEPLQQLQPKPKDSPTMPAVSTKDFSQPAQNIPQSSVGSTQVLDNRNSTSSGYAQADAQLNTAYRSAMARLDQQGQERLRSEQRNWIKERDAAVSRNPIGAEPTKLKMTILRTRELEQYR